MIVASCMLNIQTCMIYHFNQRVTADAKMYHTYLYVEHTWSYNHICTQFWRSVSPSGHGNRVLNKLTRPTRVRIRPLSKDELDNLFLVRLLIFWSNIVAAQFSLKYTVLGFRTLNILHLSIQVKYSILCIHKCECIYADFVLFLHYPSWANGLTFKWVQRG